MGYSLLCILMRIFVSLYVLWHCLYQLGMLHNRPVVNQNPQQNWKLFACCFSVEMHKLNTAV